MDDLTGQIIAERYHVEKKIGEGGMATVWLATNIAVGSSVAVKVLREPMAEESKAAQRCLREAQAASMIGHDNIVYTYDFGRTNCGRIFIAMEYLVGENLASLLASGGPLSWARVAPMALQICSALDAAHHRGIIHRDIKPSNCFRVDLAGNPDFIKLIDFGVAKDLNATVTDLTAEGFLVGTPQYMAPELIDGQPPNPRSDVYALGVTLYKLLTNSLPFEGDTIFKILRAHKQDRPPSLLARAPAGHDLTQDVEMIINQALAKDPERRFRNARHFAHFIQASLGVLSNFDNKTTLIKTSRRSRSSSSSRMSGRNLGLPETKVASARAVWSPPARSADGSLVEVIPPTVAVTPTSARSSCSEAAPIAHFGEPTFRAVERPQPQRRLQVRSHSANTQDDPTHGGTYVGARSDEAVETPRSYNSRVLHIRQAPWREYISHAMGLIALVAFFRIAWGVIGPSEARSSERPPAKMPVAGATSPSEGSPQHLTGERAAAPKPRSGVNKRAPTAEPEPPAELPPSGDMEEHELIVDSDEDKILEDDAAEVASGGDESAGEVDEVGAREEDMESPSPLGEVHEQVSEPEARPKRLDLLPTRRPAGGFSKRKAKKLLLPYQGKLGKCAAFEVGSVVEITFSVPPSGMNAKAIVSPKKYKSAAAIAKCAQDVVSAVKFPKTTDGGKVPLKITPRFM